MSRFCLLFQLFILFLARNGAAQVSFEASVDSRNAVVGATIEVKFLLKNGSGDRFRAPDFGGFKVTSGPNLSQGMTMINGQVTRSQAWSFMLLALKPGKFSIGAASVFSGGKNWKTHPIEIEVGAIRNRSGGLKNVPPGSTGKTPEVFLRAQPSTSEAWVGQQISVDFTICTRVDLRGWEVNAEPDFAGFFSQPLARFDQSDKQETIENRLFLAKTIRRTAIFAQQAGAFEIGRMVIQAGVVEAGGGGFGGLFSTTRPVALATEPLKIQVKSLPSGAPENFSGAVGDFMLNASIDRREATTDDAILLKIMLTGDGDAKRIGPPKLNLPAEFEVLEPRLADESSYENGEQVIGVKTWEYTLLPKAAGEFQLHPEVAVFDAVAGRFMSLKMDEPFAVRISMGKKPVGENSSGLGKTDFLPNATATELQPIGPPFFGSTRFWSLLVLPFGILVGLFFLKKRSENRANRPVSAEKLARQPIDEAEKRLAQVHRLLRSGNEAEFYEEVARGLDGYFAMKFRLDPAAISREAVRQKMAGEAASPEILEQLEAVWQTCDLARYGGFADSDSMHSILKKAELVLQELERGGG